MTVLKPNVICHAPGERCRACDHYHGKAPVCAYAPSEKSQPTLDDVLAFLCGERDLMGFWYGAGPAKRPFWWREHLRAAAQSANRETARLDLIEKTCVYPWKDFGCWKFRLGKTTFRGATAREALDAALASTAKGEGK